MNAKISHQWSIKLHTLTSKTFVDTKKLKYHMKHLSTEKPDHFCSSMSTNEDTFVSSDIVTPNKPERSCVWAQSAKLITPRRSPTWAASSVKTKQKQRGESFTQSDRLSILVFELFGCSVHWHSELLWSFRTSDPLMKVNSDVSSKLKLKT